MKVIDKKKDEIELIWGNKYRVKEKAGNLEESDIVVLLSSKIDKDGEVQIATKNNSKWIEPRDLQEIDQVTLEEITREDNTLLVEINKEELEILGRSVSYLSEVNRNRFASENKPSILLREIEELLTMIAIDNL